MKPHEGPFDNRPSAVVAMPAVLVARASAPPFHQEIAAAERAVQAADPSIAKDLARASQKLDEARAALAAGQHEQARRRAAQQPARSRWARCADLDRIMTRTRRFPAPRRAFMICLCGLLLALPIEPARCQGSVADPIGRARNALEAARSERAVRALAAAQLDAAEQALERALAAFQAQQPHAEIEHLAYLAERRATIAWMHARHRRAERELMDLSAAYGLILEARLLAAGTARLPGKSQAAPAEQAAR